MPKSKKSSNRHPVDRLSDVREQIKLLEAEEKSLRQTIIDTGDTVGLEFVAMIKSNEQKRLDRPTLEARFGKAAVDECTKPVSFQTLNLFRKAEVFTQHPDFLG